ncbi:MAG: TIGR02594 family protein [Gammaproteobacteria bacterium]|nr:TIGR02594 family protein [Gammaproteobacteria bacterium]
MNYFTSQRDLWEVGAIPKLTLQRPTFGGGTRPTQGGSYPQVCGLGEAAWGQFNLFNPFLNLDRDDDYPAVEPAKVEAAHTKNAPWMKTAIGEIGVAERKGKYRANPRILEYFKASKFWGKDDSGGKNAWCGSFAAWVMQKNGIKPVARAYRAKEWKNFGKKIDKPVYGALGIKSRKGGGHVAFIVGQSKDGNKYYMLGGNQDNKVQISEYPMKVWETFVFPIKHDASKGVLPIHTGKTAKAGSEA